MPTVMLHLQKNFELVIHDELPQASVKLVDRVEWLMCCPLCGCMHQIMGVDETQPYTPMCQSIPLLYKVQQDSWRKLHPETAQYKALYLIGEAKSSSV